MFHKESYELHEKWYNEKFPTPEAKSDYFKRSRYADTTSIGYWLQRLFFDCLNPLLKNKAQKWLTVGDAYGFDARYILSNGNQATATDLNTDFLSIAHQEGIVNDFRSENAEKLSFEDNSYDFVLCKESYHHFPRPYSALYEMIRVCKKGIVIIEPQDPISKMPLLLFMVNTLNSIRSNLGSKVWKNRFSYEPVGNFVYKVSEREFEKFAAGLNLPLVAFKRINPNFYFSGAEGITADKKNKKFRSIYLKKSILDLLLKLKIIPGQVLSAIVFKESPTAEELQLLKKEGYKLQNIPKNPYLN
ncbi:class I SAM-dependent methyltransferase [Pedobacter sp. PLR]|uniref:class I SAM-dependent methyltransferase n=1 Tax=Pedobacter sp. PLR TaxID=2994465 RepID=UPI00224728F7|nr:class I SAM-dependent methyltransferase [Pedobacter sp. PLR]MCX2451211.1 class I SAM-dependent methyltransferase [Pedobacter sp. PLR]